MNWFLIIRPPFSLSKRNFAYGNKSLSTVFFFHHEHLRAALAPGNQKDTRKNQKDCHDLQQVERIHPPIYRNDTGHYRLNITIHAHYRRAQTALRNRRKQIAEECSAQDNEDHSPTSSSGTEVQSKVISPL